MYVLCDYSLLGSTVLSSGTVSLGPALCPFYIATLVSGNGGIQASLTTLGVRPLTSVLGSSLGSLLHSLDTHHRHTQRFLTSMLGARNLTYRTLASVMFFQQVGVKIVTCVGHANGTHLVVQGGPLLRDAGQHGTQAHGEALHLPRVVQLAALQVGSARTNGLHGSG